MKKIRLMWLVGLLFIIHNSQAKNYYFDDVATHGSGTMASPFNDFSLLQYTLLAGDTLFIMPGTYNITTPIRVRNNGTISAPIVYKAYDSNNRPLITGQTMILRIQNNYQVYEGLILDGQFVGNQLVSIRDSKGVKIKNCIVRKTLADGIILHNGRDCEITGCEIYYCLAGTFASQTDAHGVCAMHQRNLLIRDCDIHHVSGDCIQTDPHYDNQDEGALLWDSVFVENCKIWTSPLPENMGGFLAGESPGENGIDTKTYPWVSFETYRPYISIKNVEAYGFTQNGYVHNRAAFNIKHNVRAEIENCILHDNEHAYRLRGEYTDPPYDLGGAHVIMKNCIGYNNINSVWFERTIEVAKLYNCTFDKRSTDEFFDYTFGGFNPNGFEMKNCVFVGSMPDNHIVMQDDSHYYATWESNNIVAQATDFRNYAIHDYYASAGSTIINKGVNLANLTYDITGYARLAGTYDAGAYEYRGENPEDPDLIAPSTPTNLSATALTTTSVRLNWKKSTDNIAITGYRIYRGGSQIAATSDTTYTNTGLTASTAYTYYVCAYDAANNISGNSNSATVTTSAIPDATAPTAPTGLTATAASSTSVDLSWTASTDNVGVTGYRIYRGGTQITTTTSTSYTNTGLTASTAYSYYVRAYDAAGNVSSNSSTVNVTTLAPPDATAPTAPTGLTATAASSTSVNLSWTASTDNVGVTGYRIYRGGTQIATTTGTTYSNTGLVASTAYSYYIRAYDAAGNVSTNSNTANVTTLAAPDVTAPSAPTSLTATAVSFEKISLSWNASTDNVGVTGYRIFRGSVQIAITTETTYSDSEVSELTEYNYNVKAYDAAGNLSSNSNTVNVTTPAAPDVIAPTDPKHLNATALSSTSAHLEWERSTDNQSVKEYRIYRDDIEIAVLSDTSYIDTGLTDSTSYSYHVVAYDAAENESAKSNTAIITTPKNADNPTAISHSLSNNKDGYTFPNPAVSVVKCKLNNTKSGVLKQVVVVNIIGATVLSFSNVNVSSDGIISLNINSLSKGHYYIKMNTESDQNIKVFKFIKK